MTRETATGGTGTAITVVTGITVAAGVNEPDHDQDTEATAGDLRYLAGVTPMTEHEESVNLAGMRDDKLVISHEYVKMNKVTCRDTDDDDEVKIMQQSHFPLALSIMAMMLMKYYIANQVIVLLIQ